MLAVLKLPSSKLGSHMLPRLLYMPMYLLYICMHIYYIIDMKNIDVDTEKSRYNYRYYRTL